MMTTLTRISLASRQVYTSTRWGGRCFSTSGMPSRDRKRRFYVEVGVQSCEAPWEENLKIDAGISAKSVISAGVDGTDSASGVSNKLELNHDRLRKALTPRLPGSRYEEDNPNSTKDWFTITLDGRRLRTPLGRTLAVPSKYLAHAIAVEWNSVGIGNMSGEAPVSNSNYIMPTQMPFMTLTCTALDQTSSQATIYREQCLRYLHTDTVCYWADPVEDRVLYGRQQNAWKDLHNWVTNDFAQCHPSVAIGHMEGMMLAKGRKGLGHSPALVKFCEEWTASLDAWHLTALHSVCAEAKSFLVGAAILMRHKCINQQTGKKSTYNIDIDGALAAGRSEEEFNIETWGLVEGGHDYDRVNASIQITSASLLIDYLSLSYTAEDNL